MEYKIIRWELLIIIYGKFRGIFFKINFCGFLVLFYILKYLKYKGENLF